MIPTCSLSQSEQGQLDQSGSEFISFNLKTNLSNKTSNRIPFFYFLFKFIVLSQKLKITGRARELRHVACSINQTVLMHSSCSLLPSRMKVACMTLFTAGGGFRAISNRCCHDPISLIKWGASLWWSSLNFPVQNSGQMPIGKTHPTLFNQKARFGNAALYKI